MIKILDGDCPDPAVFREGDTFYLTYSSGPYYPGLPICSSTDLVNWKMETYAVKDFEGKEIWAPDFFKYKDNKYYIYFSGAGTNWVIWSEHIQGPWSEPIDLKVGYIDPGHVTDEEGKRYLLLSGGHIVPLAADGLSIDLEPQNTNAYDGFLSVRPGVFARESGQAVVSEIEYRTI